MVNCNRICFVKELRVSFDPHAGSMYDNGFVRCPYACQCYFDPKDCLKSPNGRLLCPCCKSAIRHKARAKHNRMKIEIHN